MLFLIIILSFKHHDFLYFLFKLTVSMYLLLFVHVLYMTFLHYFTNFYKSLFLVVFNTCDYYNLSIALSRP